MSLLWPNYRQTDRTCPAQTGRSSQLGRCQCGAVYASDETGHNVGAAMVEALVYACNDDWDLAWSLVPEDDYLTGRLENYDADNEPGGRNPQS